MRDISDQRRVIVKKEVLSAFSDRIIRDVIREYCEPLGIACRDAEDSERAIAILKHQEMNIGIMLLEHVLEQNPSGIISDEAHIEHTERIIRKCLKARPGLKIFVFAEDLDRERIVRFMRMGAYDVFPRPFDLDELLLAVEKGLST